MPLMVRYFFIPTKFYELWLASSYFKAMQFSYLVENLWINLDVIEAHIEFAVHADKY